jgi:acyl-ACP thioesterase
MGFLGGLSDRLWWGLLDEPSVFSIQFPTGYANDQVLKVFLPSLSSTFGAVDPLQKPLSAELGASTMVDRPTSGRTFTTTRRVSIDDADPSGRMELDAIARFLQDAGNDDTDDASLAELGLAWVARRASIDVLRHASSREELTLTTWCSGTGRLWAERRTSIHGQGGAHIEAAAIWVHLDRATGRPVPWGESFAETYLEAAAGRQVDSRLRHLKGTPPASSSTSWEFRSTDLDAFGHVNNAAYLAIAEEHFTLDDGPYRIEIEWRGPSQAHDPLEVLAAPSPDGEQIWVRSGKDHTLRVTMLKRPITD